MSTVKQGEGVSLAEQRDAIVRYAERSGLPIIRWFEEKETAAKRGRPVFSEMLKLLQRNRAAGVIIHKIDRSARNLRDWADLGELIDRGIDVRFANESLDLQTRGGRLSADIQAVVAADFIRNLREEAKKGIYGRFKQGLYPMPAPLGYTDLGPGKPKEPDPVQGSLVRTAFELYATGQFNLTDLAREMAGKGLTNRNGKTVTRSGWSVVLNNPFYMGLIHVRTTGDTFAGVHKPLVTAFLFKRVQRVLNGKMNAKIVVHDFQFRRLLTCGLCGYALVGERQKGHVYYRCHTRGCHTKGIREQMVEDAVLTRLRPLQFSAKENQYLRDRLLALRGRWQEEASQRKESLDLRLRQLTERLARLTDAYLDGDLDKNLFAERKGMLLTERREVEDTLDGRQQKNRQAPERLAIFLELAGNAYLSYKTGLPEERRALLKIVTSNRTMTDKSLEISLVPPFKEISDRLQDSNGGAKRNRARTWTKLLAFLGKFLTEDPIGERIEAFVQEKDTRMSETGKGEVAA